MPLIYITGISGAGKSTVAKELKARGFEAYDSDEDGFSVWHDTLTGKTFDKKLTSAERTPEFNARYKWIFSKERISALAARLEQRRAFLCGSAANDIDVWEFFTTAIALTLDEETLRQRITTRTTNDFGKSAHEWQQILRWQRGTNENYRRIGMITIDAAKPLGHVVDEILKLST